MPYLINSIGEKRLAAALDLSLDVEGLPNDDSGPDITQEQLEDFHLVDEAKDKVDDLIYAIKVCRYEAREAFESLLRDLYPRRFNE